MKQKEAALLVRVSTDRQAYDRQINDLVALARTEGYTIPQQLIYAEIESGFSDFQKRVELTRLLEDIRNGEKNIKMIYVSEVTRIARNPRKIRAVVEEAADLGVCFNIAGMGRTLNADGSENDITMMMINVLAQFAKIEADTTKARSRSGKKFAAMNGKYNGGNYLPYGYDKDENSTLIVHPQESEIVKEMYQLAIDGLGTKQISNILNQRSIPTKSSKVPWSEKTVYNVLTQTLNKGIKKYISKKEDKAKGIEAVYEYFEGMPAIVSPEIWEDANIKIKARNVNKARNTRYFYLLDGKAKCGCCGKGYHAKYSQGKASYYMCYNRKFGKSKCDNAGINIALFESAVWGAIKVHPHIWDNLLKGGIEMREVQSQIKKLSTELELAQQNLKSKLKEKTKITNLIIKDVLEEMEGEKMLKKVIQDIAKLEEKQKAIADELKLRKEWQIRLTDTESIVKTIKDVSNDRLKIGSVLDKVLEKVIINSVTKGCNSEEFVISIFLFGKKKPLTILFNKKTMISKNAYEINKVKLYDDNNILQEDVKLVADIIDKIKKNPLYSYQEPVHLVPFSLINIYDQKKVS
ncbi:MAG: recombinase family protein [Chitinophagaceae bacterium]